MRARRAWLSGVGSEVTLFARMAAFGIIVGAVYWFLTYEVAGTILLSTFGLASAIALWGLAGVGFAGAYMPGLKALTDRLQAFPAAAGGDHSRSITAYTASFDLKPWLGIIHRALQNIQRVRGRIFRNDLIESAIDDPLSHGFFPTLHYSIH